MQCTNLHISKYHSKNTVNLETTPAHQKLPQNYTRQLGASESGFEMSGSSFEKVLSERGVLLR